MPDVNNVQKFVTPAQFASYVKPLRNAVDALVLIVRDHDVITPSATSWADVQAIVRAGLADKAFPIGTKMYCHRGNDILEWDVIGIDHDTPADPQFTHSLTLQLHDCFPTVMQFDAPEALYYCESALAAGTYHFAYSGTNYQFTTSAEIAERSQLILNFTGDTPTSIFVSATVGGDFVKDTNGTNNLTIAVTAGSGGDKLGGDELRGVNNVDRTRYGSNNYKESAIRQWLGSSAAAGSFVWTPQTNFDRPPAWKDTAAGFMNGMDADFLAVLGNVTKVTAVPGSNPPDTTTDPFFLLSRSEAFAGNISGTDEGAAYPYYAAYSDYNAASEGADSNRVKHINGNAGFWWCRSSTTINFRTVRGFLNNGKLGENTAGGNGGVCPACNII